MTIRRSGSVLSLAVLSILFQCACLRNSAQYLKKANELFAARAYSDACLNYRKAVRKDEKSAEAYYRLGICQYTVGQTNDSLASLQEARTLAPQREDILAELADVMFNRYLQSNKPQKLYTSVQQLVGELLTRDPDSVTGLRLRASLLLGDGKVDEAIDGFSKALALSPADPAISLPLADALRRAGRIPEGERVALESIGKNPSFGPLYMWLNQVYTTNGQSDKAEEILRQYAMKNPDNLDAVVTFAVDRYQHQRFADAKPLLDDILRNKNIAARYLAVGDLFRDCADPGDAETTYKAGIASDTAHKNMYRLRLAEAYAARNRTSDALAVLGDSLRDNPNDVEPAMLRTSILAGSGQLEVALKEAVKLSHSHPKDSRVAALIGTLYAQNGDSASARQQFLIALNQDPGNYNALMGMANLSRESRDYKGMLTYAQQAVAVRPFDASAHLMRAAALARNNRGGEAEPELKALSENPSTAAESKLELGLLYLGKGNPKQAVVILEPLCRDGKASALAQTSLANAYMAAREADAGIAFFSSLVARNPEAPDARYLLGAIAERANKPALAEQQYQTLIDKFPGVAAYSLAMAAFLQNQNEVGRALPYFERAFKAAPSDAAVAGQLAMAYQAVGDAEKADATYAASVKLGQGDPAFLNNYAYFLATTDRDAPRAVLLAKKALEGRPNDPDFSDTLAVAYLKAGDRGSAEDILNGLIRRYPQRAAFRYHLALVLSASGEPQKAREQIVSGLAAHPSLEEQKGMRELLAKMGS